MAKPNLIIVMGVSGCGKSTLASKLAKRLDAAFLEADDFHSPEAKHQMASGVPLSDQQRGPWIQRLCHHVRVLRQRHDRIVLAYSGLKRVHRQQFRHLGMHTLFILLQLDKTLLSQRLAQRQSHFFPLALMNTQLADLDAPDNEPDIHCLDANQPNNTLLLASEALVESDVNACQ